MQKKGKFRAIRNLVVGWITQANHRRDKTERCFHYCMEAVCQCTLVSLGIMVLHSWKVAIIAAVVFHTFWWVVNGNFHVYMLDSFKWVRNAGIARELDYIQWVARRFSKSPIRAILIYGSFCRREFHGRSDLDVRIIRDTSRPWCSLMFLGTWARIISFVRGVPTDLQIVDSEEFLKKQLLAEEVPVNVFGGKSLSITKTSLDLSEVVANPAIVLKLEREFEK